jgi:hypothetical protein
MASAEQVARNDELATDAAKSAHHLDQYDEDAAFAEETDFLKDQYCIKDLQIW